MKTFVLILNLILWCAIGGNAQNPQSTPVSPPPIFQPTPSQASRIQPDTNESFNRFKAPSGSKNDYSVSDFRVLNANIQSVYRRTNKKELEFLSPEKSDVNRFANFLRYPKTGIVKLLPDKGCAKNPNVISAIEECLKYTMPGAGSSYSFRINDYRIARLADLTFGNDNLKISGVFVQGILVNLGNVELENVNLKSAGVNYLVDFKSVDNYEKAKESSEMFTKGVLFDGFMYQRELKAIENNTFVLRSIAYDGKYYQEFDGIVYDEFRLDKRDDVIIALRIVNKNEQDGSITVLWKELARKDSPKFKNKTVETEK